MKTEFLNGKKHRLPIGRRCFLLCGVRGSSSGGTGGAMRVRSFLPREQLACALPSPCREGAERSEADAVERPRFSPAAPIMRPASDDTWRIAAPPSPLGEGLKSAQRISLRKGKVSPEQCQIATEACLAHRAPPRRRGFGNDDNGSCGAPPFYPSVSGGVTGRTNSAENHRPRGG